MRNTDQHARALRQLAVLILSLTVTLPTLGQELEIDRNVMIPLRDGVRLAADVYQLRENQATRLPIVLMRTPYGKDRERDVDAAMNFARHGYIAVVQDMRGRYASEGEFTKYAMTEPADGFDTVEWLAEQAYSNGRIGMWGTSYSAHTASDAAKLNPPALKAILLNQGGMANAWDHAVRHGGAFELGRELTWVWRQIALEYDDPVVRKLFATEKVEDWYQAMPLREGLSPLQHAPEYERYFLDEYTRSDYSDYWRTPTLNWSDYYERTADVAMLHVGGWYDIFLRGTVQNFVQLGQLKDAPVELLIGPWSHAGNARSYAGDVDFGSNAAIEDFFIDFQRRWFDRHLKEPADTGTRKAVRYFVMGTGDGSKTAEGRLNHGGYWTEADDWPLPNANPTAFYVHADGLLSTDVPTERQSSTTYVFDPDDPVPTIGGNVSARVKDGAFDQRERPDFFPSSEPFLPLRARNDVLVFQTEPLTEDVVVAGPIEVVLYTSSSAVDTDFTAKLIDVYPPSNDFPAGFDMNISDALVRASYRDQRRTRDLIEPGKVYRLTIRPFPTANVFKKGHRIRLDISSSNFPRFDVNPNTGEALGLNRRSVTADNTIYHDAERSSYVLLSVMPERPTVVSE